ncbi:MAG: Phosphate-binding protein PstS precursor [Planctomycetota bacterium]
MPIRPFTLALLAACLGTLGCSRDNHLVVNNEGSDTMLEVALAWCEQFSAVRPDIMVAVNGGGSGRGIAALINGTVDLANSSREMAKKEREAAAKRGAEPREFVVGFDAIGVYVHKDNPIESITIDQLEGIYADGGKVTRWSELGVKLPPGARDEILVVSRQNNSGTYEYFKEAVLHKKDFRLGTYDLNGSKDVVELVANTPSAIGYCGIAYATPEVKLVPVAKAAGERPVAATIENTIDKTYPIARPLFMYTSGEPQGPVKAYLDWILSDDGQRVLQRAGYPPVRKL